MLWCPSSLNLNLFSKVFLLISMSLKSTETERVADMPLLWYPKFSNQACLFLGKKNWLYSGLHSCFYVNFWPGVMLRLVYQELAVRREQEKKEILIVTDQVG